MISCTIGIIQNNDRILAKVTIITVGIFVIVGTDISVVGVRMITMVVAMMVTILLWWILFSTVSNSTIFSIAIRNNSQCSKVPMQKHRKPKQNPWPKTGELDPTPALPSESKCTPVS